MSETLCSFETATGQELLTVSAFTPDTFEFTILGQFCAIVSDDDAEQLAWSILNEIVKRP